MTTANLMSEYATRHTTEDRSGHRIGANVLVGDDALVGAFGMGACHGIITLGVRCKHHRGARNDHHRNATDNTCSHVIHDESLSMRNALLRRDDTVDRKSVV